jgi:hypothetical protein
MARFKPLVCRAARRATLAHVAPRLADVRTRAAGGTLCPRGRACATLAGIGPEAKTPAAAGAGRARKEGVRCYWLIR